MDPNRRSRLSRWRSGSVSRDTSVSRDDEEVDPHTVVSPPSPALAAATPTGPVPGTGIATGTGRSNLQPPPPRYGAAGSGRRAGSVSSRRSYNLATPDATEESETEYFPPLGVTSSAVSRSSSIRGRAPSTSGSDAGRPVYERTRQPSIRIRRGSGGSIRRQTAATDYTSESSDTDTGRRFGGPRPRSISQPMPAAQIHQDANIARYSRRVPQMALPRLTEEGSRPTLTELGIPPSPISPSRSLPEEPLDEIDPRQTVDAGPARRLTRKRKISRLFWPGSINRGSQEPSGDTEAATDGANQAQPPSDEYGEELVDWLDIIGEPQLGLEQDRQLLTFCVCH
jgi:hypothetical protein